MSMSKHDYEFLAKSMREFLADTGEDIRPQARLAFLDLANKISMNKERYKNFNHKKFVKAAKLKEE